jgi:hypothetical protein
MPRDPLQDIADAEKEIEARIAERKKAGPQFRTLVAAEQVADELTRIRAELKTFRSLFAYYSAMQRQR